MEKKYNWHVGFYVKNMTHSNICHIILWWDTESKSYRYCYMPKSNEQSAWNSNIILFKKESNSLIVERFMTITSVKENKIADVTLKEPMDMWGYVHPVIYINGNKLFLSEVEVSLIIESLNQYDIYCKKKEFDYSPLSKFHLQSVYKEIKAKVNKYNLQDILDNMQIEVRQSFKTKIGGDDTYTATQYTTIQYPEEDLDKFLIEHFQIGHVIISYDEDFNAKNHKIWDKLIIGKFSAEQVEKQKNALLSTYNKEEHCISLLLEYIEKYDLSLMALLNPTGKYNSKLCQKEISLANHILNGKNLNKYLAELDKSTGNTNFHKTKISDESLLNINSKLSELCKEYLDLAF